MGDAMPGAFCESQPTQGKAGEGSRTAEETDEDGDFGGSEPGGEEEEGDGSDESGYQLQLRFTMVNCCCIVYCQCDSTTMR